MWSAGETRQGNVDKSSLPPEQTGTAAPFEFTTKDLFGPYEVRDEVKKIVWRKVWGNCVLLHGLQSHKHWFGRWPVIGLCWGQARSAAALQISEATEPVFKLLKRHKKMFCKSEVCKPFEIQTLRSMLPHLDSWHYVVKLGKKKLDYQVINCFGVKNTKMSNASIEIGKLVCNLERERF